MEPVVMFADKGCWTKVAGGTAGRISEALAARPEPLAERCGTFHNLLHRHGPETARGRGNGPPLAMIIQLPSIPRVTRADVEYTTTRPHE